MFLWQRRMGIRLGKKNKIIYMTDSCNFAYTHYKAKLWDQFGLVLPVLHSLTCIYDSRKYKETRRVKDFGWKAITLYYIAWGEVRLNPLGT
jgi:hypothetical protein